MTEKLLHLIFVSYSNLVYSVDLLWFCMNLILIWIFRDMYILNANKMNLRVVFCYSPATTVCCIKFVRLSSPAISSHPGQALVCDRHIAIVLFSSIICVPWECQLFLQHCNDKRTKDEVIIRLYPPHSCGLRRKDSHYPLIITSGKLQTINSLGQPGIWI